jgi:hypothetical protein
MKVRNYFIAVVLISLFSIIACQGVVVTPVNWEIYQKPLVYDNMIPNAGIKDIQPPPDAKPSKKPASSPDEVFQVEGDKKDKK